MANPLLQLDLDIPFDRIEASHVRPAADALIESTRKRLDEIAAHDGPRSYANTLEALEGATEPLERCMAVVSHLEGVATTPELREAYNEAQPKVSELFSSIPLHEGLWTALKEYAETEEARGLGGTRARFLDKTMEDFRRHGADLPADGKKRLSEIDVELSKLTNQFAQNMLDGTNAFELTVTDEDQLSGLPASAREAARHAAEEKGKEGWRFTLHAPSLIPVLTYLDDRSIRERVWRAYNNRAASGDFDNRPLVRRILKLRRDKAKLLGYDHWVDFVTEDRMAKSGSRARGFVDRLRSQTEPFFVEENEELRAFVREETGSDELAPWDVAYWAEKRRRKLFDFDEEELRPYFPADRVLDGLFETVQRLYGVRIERREDAPVWDPAVRAYRLLDADGRHLGSFYSDLHPRENKRGGAWMSGLMTQASPDPQLGVFCANVSPPVGGKPALLRHSEVETLFHEFGHLMHHLLSEVDVRSLGGTRVAWDFVELPSQIMENWCWERVALDLFAHHHETGEPIPQELFDKMLRARTYRAANFQMRQLGFATLDLVLHMDFDPDGDEDPIGLARRVLQDHAPAPLPDDYAMVAGFPHLFAGSVAYSGGYYSYKWAEVLDADAFTRFRDEGVFDERVGRSFRSQILSQGDSRDPDELYRAFMGRDPKVEPLLERQGLLRAPE